MRYARAVMRCRHRRVQAAEEWSIALCSFQVDGEVVQRTDTDYETTGMFEVRCLDCPAMVRASMWARAVPRWARDAIQRHIDSGTA